MEQKKVRTCEQELKGLGVIVAVAGAVIVSCLSGCAVPALLGVKSYQSGETRIDFITGADFHLGANGLDTINDNRGIAPGAGFNSQPKAQQAKY